MIGILGRIFGKKQKKEIDSAIIIANDRIKNRKKSSAKKVSKKKTTVGKKRKQSFAAGLRNRDKGKDPLIDSIFRDESGELCVRSTKPLALMSDDEFSQFQRESLLALMEYGKAKRNLS